MNLGKSKLYKQYKFLIRPFIATLLLFVIAILGNQFVNGWNWGTFDFIVMGLLIFITGVAVELAVKKFKNPNYKYIAVFLIIAGLVWLWAELTVGIFTNWGS